MENRCVCCCEIIPEGRMVCPQCEVKVMYKNVLNESKESKAKGLLKLNANGDVVRVKGLEGINLKCYDSDGKYVGKVSVI